MPTSELRNQPRFESLEGLSGCGKSTVAPLLAAARSAVLVRTVPPAFQPLRREIDRRANVEARMCFYLSALLTSADEVQHHLDAGIPVVVESYFARCLANHRAFGAQLGVTLPPGLPEPVSYELTCTEGERRRRLSLRGGKTSRWDALAEASADHIVSAYSRFPMHRIDTTARTPAEVVHAILAIDQQGIQRHANAEPLGADSHLLSAVPRPPEGARA